eukprot:1145586-Pelagomonas_calceolata.AAC.2
MGKQDDAVCATDIHATKIALVSPLLSHNCHTTCKQAAGASGSTTAASKNLYPTITSSGTLISAPDKQLDAWLTYQSAPSSQHLIVFVGSESYKLTRLLHVI